MKKTSIVLLFFISIFAFLLFPKVTLAICPNAADCCGVVTNTNGQPLAGVTVRVQISGGVVRTNSTGSDGHWGVQALVPFQISFSKEGYRDKTCNVGVAIPDSCGGGGYSSCENIQTQMESEETEGWQCLDPNNGLCEPVIGGPYDSQETCEINCQRRYRCDSVTGCILCPLGESIDTCPYTSSSGCDAECVTASGFKCEDKSCIPCARLHQDPGCFYAIEGQCADACSLDLPNEGYQKPQPTPCEVNNDPEGGIETALGCIPIKNTGQFIGWILARAIGVGGGIAFLLMIFAGFQIITSSGDPKKLQAGKEMLGSAIAGLVLIIFSLFLLQLIGVRILNIPGFGQ